MQVGKESLYHKVWKVEEVNGMKKVDLGDSKKNKDGSYDNWTWFGCLFVSKAKELDISEGDTIKIISGQVQKRKYEGKFYDNVVIFDAEIMTKGEGKTPDTDDDLTPEEEYSDGEMQDMEIPF